MQNHQEQGDGPASRKRGDLCAVLSFAIFSMFSFLQGLLDLVPSALQAIRGRPSGPEFQLTFSKQLLFCCLVLSSPGNLAPTLGMLRAPKCPYVLQFPFSKWRISVLGWCRSGYGLGLCARCSRILGGRLLYTENALRIMVYF